MDYRSLSQEEQELGTGMEMEEKGEKVEEVVLMLEEEESLGSPRKERFDLERMFSHNQVRFG